MAAKLHKVAYDFANAEAQIAVVKMQGDKLIYLTQLPIIDGIEEINYTPSIEREKMYGVSRNPVARTDGIADYEASITMQLYWWRYLIDVCADLGLGLAQIELNIHYTVFKDLPPIVSGAEMPVYWDLLYRCAIKSPESAYKRGPETLMTTVSLDPMNIYYNGLDMFGREPG